MSPGEMEDCAQSSVSEGKISSVEMRQQEVNVYERLHFMLVTRSGGVMALVLSTLVLPAKPTVNDLRTALLRTPLAGPKYDTFLENWAKFFYLSRRDIYGKVRRLQDDGTLQRLLRDELRMPGTVTFCLEQCRNPRYSKDRQYQHSFNWIPDLNEASEREESFSSVIPPRIKKADVRDSDSRVETSELSRFTDSEAEQPAAVVSEEVPDSLSAIAAVRAHLAGTAETGAEQRQPAPQLQVPPPAIPPSGVYGHAVGTTPQITLSHANYPAAAMYSVPAAMSVATPQYDYYSVMPTHPYVQGYPPYPHMWQAGNYVAVPPPYPYM